MVQIAIRDDYARSIELVCCDHHLWYGALAYQSVSTDGWCYQGDFECVGCHRDSDLYSRVFHVDTRFSPSS